MTIPPRRALSDEERVDWLRLSHANNVGPITFFALLRRYGSVGAAIAELPRLAEKAGRTRAPSVPAAAEIKREIDRTARLGARHIAACEPDYPESLAAIEDAPPVISAGRNIALFERPSVAIVGARNASLNGRRIAAKLANL